MPTVEQTKELIPVLATYFGALHKEIAKDGFQFTDLAVAGATAYASPEFAKALEGVQEIGLELKDLQVEEFLELVETAAREAREEILAAKAPETD